MDNNLYFRHSNGKLELCKENVELDEVLNIIYFDVQNRGYEKPCYVKCSYNSKIENAPRKYDFGSWSEFYFYADSPEKIKTW